MKWLALSNSITKPISLTILLITAVSYKKMWNHFSKYSHSLTNYSCYSE